MHCEKKQKEQRVETNHIVSILTDL